MQFATTMCKSPVFIARLQMCCFAIQIITAVYEINVISKDDNN